MKGLGRMIKYYRGKKQSLFKNSLEKRQRNSEYWKNNAVHHVNYHAAY